MDSSKNTPEVGSASSHEPTNAPPTSHSARTGLTIFCPHRMVDSVMHVTAEELYARGIRGVILDLDNTVVMWQQEQIAEPIMEWLKTLQGAGLKLCILSNSILSKRSERIAQLLGCHNVRKARKPSKSGFHRAMTMMETTPATTAMIGDQMFTDIWGGNRTGLYTIMVKQMETREFVYTRYVSRPPERLLLRWFKKLGHI